MPVSWPFPAHDLAQWQAAIQKELKGLALESLSKSWDDISIQPGYVAIPNGEQKIVVPRRSAAGWQFAQYLLLHAPIADQAKASLDEGIKQLWIEQTKLDAAASLQPDVATQSLHTIINYLPDNELFKQYLAHSNGFTLSDETKRGASNIYFDPILLSLQHTANPGTSLNTWLSGLNSNTSSGDPLALFVDTAGLEAAGASAVQQLGWGLATAHYYTQHAPNKPITWRIAIGSNYLLEIAKLRAARYLSNLYMPSVPVHLHTITTRSSISATDPYTNLIRSTTMAMAAILGGTDSLAVWPYDLASGTHNPQSAHLSRTLHWLLRDEAFLGQVADPLAGAYALENVMASVIHHTTALFDRIQASGGASVAVSDGALLQELKATAARKAYAIKNGHATFIGVNAYPPTSEALGLANYPPVFDTYNPDTLQPWNGPDLAASYPKPIGKATES